jgi:hypothetical protein
MPVRFKRTDEEGYALEVKLPVPDGKRGSWKHVCYLTRAGDLGMVDPWGPKGGYWCAMLGDRATSPSRVRKTAVAAFVSMLERDLKRDTNRINFIRDPYDARLEGEKLFVMDRQLVVEELRRHFPRADA